MARLHGYPDWMRFHRTKWHGARQVGNSVPPPLARAVAGTIYEALHEDGRPERPQTPLRLGSTEWLGLDPSDADRLFADFGSVLLPGGAREGQDRKCVGWGKRGAVRV